MTEFPDSLTNKQRQEIADALAAERLDIVNEIQTPVVARHNGIYVRYVKRFIDIVVSIVALVITLPINAAIAAATYFDVGSPIFFHQERAGKDGRHFVITKFRNMRNTVDESGELLPASERVTKFGKFVRKTSMDELLNFWSILKGDMSLIGPRPLLPSYTNRYSKRHRSRLLVRPGLECPPRRTLDHAWSWDEQFENDVWYVEHISFLTDCKMVINLIMYALNRKSSTARGGAARKSFIGYSVDGKAIAIDDLSAEEIKAILDEQKGAA